MAAINTTDNAADKPQAPERPARLVVQFSIPFDDIVNAESWYKMLKEMVASQSSDSTLNGTIIKQLEPCCGKNAASRLNPGVSNIGPTPFVRL